MSNSSISYKQLGLLILVFILGLTTALLLQNSKTDIESTFTTIELIGFVLSVILSGSSIVLAITAIALGKSSEQAVIKRSDESIRLQNDVFIKTTEALQRIEASTGVTEKRIEDIITGRVGDISHSLAELTSSKRRGLGFNQDELEKEIRRSIMREVKETRTPEEEAERKRKREEEKNRYETFHQLALSSFSNRDDTKAEKLGHGNWIGEGEDLFDGIYHRGGDKIGLAAFNHADSSEISKLNDYITSVSKLIIENVIQYAVLVFDSSPEDQDKIIAEISEQVSLFKDNPIEKIKIIASDLDNLEKALTEIKISNK